VTDRPKVLTRQLVVRVPRNLRIALQRDADDNGRTVAQSVRFHLTRELGNRCSDSRCSDNGAASEVAS
jgi:hypothetical protein